MTALIEEMIGHLADEIIGRKVVFFVGAGISIASGAPSGKDIVDGVVKHLFEAKENLWTDRKELKEYRLLKKEFLERARPETLFNYIELYREKASGKDKIPIIDQLFEGLKELEPSYIHHFIAALIKKKYVAHILCLNYDRLIEEACKQKSMGINLYHTIEDFKGLSSKNYKGGPAIYKFHGSLSISGEKTGTLQMAVRQVIPFDPGKADCIKWFMNNKSFVFLGCSGNDDFDITPILLDNEANGTFYWIDHHTDPKIELSNVDKDRLSKSEKIIYEQQKKTKVIGEKNRIHYHISANTGQFIEALVRKIEQKYVTTFEIENKPTVASKFEKELDSWMKLIPKGVKDLALANLLVDYGYREEALVILRDISEKKIDPHLFYEAVVLTGQTLHETKKYGEAIETFIDFETRLKPSRSKNDVLFLCRSFKRRGFIYRDMAYDVEDREVKKGLWKLAEEIFDKWKTTLEGKKHLFPNQEEYESNLYEAERDKAWALRDQGKLVEALQLMDVNKFPDVYNKAKVCIDAGWFALDEAKRRYFNDINCYKDFLEKAESFFHDAIKYADRGGYVEIKAQCYRSLPNIYQFKYLINENMAEETKKELKKEAEKSLSKSFELFEELGIENERAITLQEEALLCYAFGEIKKASQKIDDAAKRLKSSRVQSQLWKTKKIKEDICAQKPYKVHFREMSEYLFD